MFATLGIRRRARRALERQAAYQRLRADFFRGREDELIGRMRRRAATVRRRLSAWGRISGEMRLLEVGCGPSGHIFFFGLDHAVGIDPLAEQYAELYPSWYSPDLTLAAAGEALPFGDGSFDIALCDNVVDHAENPQAIVAEIARVLAPDGLLYFSVNVHHPLYQLVSIIHAAWGVLGIRFEITPFADHTIHFTPAAARSLFDGLPLRRLWEADDVEQIRRNRKTDWVDGPAGLVRRLFFKNARYELIASRRG